VNVDLSEKDMDGEGERCSFGVDDLVLAKGDTSDGNERGDENLRISTWESCGDPWSAVDLRTVVEQLDFCDFEIGVLIDVCEVLGVLAVGHDGILLEDNAVEKITHNIKDVSYCYSHMVRIFFSF